MIIKVSQTGHSPVVNEAHRPKFAEIYDVPGKDYILINPSRESNFRHFLVSILLYLQIVRLLT
jgi:hypothetical protein